MLDPEIRRATVEDSAVLATASEQGGYCAERLVRQAAGLGVLLVAWDRDRPVGWTFLWTAPAEEEDLRVHLPGVPLITHVEVFQQEDRNQGVGSKLLTHAEDFLAARHSQVALAVEVSNKDAARLYERLRYREWDSQELLVCVQREWLPNGSVVETEEKCVVMVKDLTRTPTDQFADGGVPAAVA